MNKVLIKEKQLQGLKSYELNTALCPIVCVAMYGTQLSPEEWNDQEIDYATQRIPEPFICLGDFDWVRYTNMLARVAQYLIDGEAMPILQKYGIAAIKTLHINSPREYNFENDELVMNVYVEENFMELFYKNMEKFSADKRCLKYLDRIYTHRSGFISFMPQSMAEIQEFEDEVRCLACYITFALLVENYWDIFEDEDPINWIYEYISSNECPTDCCNVYSYCSDEWLKLYNNDHEISNLIWDVYYEIGRPWLDYKADNIEHKGELKTEADHFVIWATDMGYSPQDLRELCR